MQIDALKSGLDNLYALISSANTPHVFNATNVTAGAPVVRVGDGENPNNTEVLITAGPNRGFSGTKLVTYNRVELAQVGGSVASSVLIEPTDSYEDICAKIAENALSGAALILDDIEFYLDGALVDGVETQFPVPENEDDDTVVITVAAKDDSYVYLGDISFYLTVPDIDIPLDIAITTANLPGFEPFSG